MVMGVKSTSIMLIQLLRIRVITSGIQVDLSGTSFQLPLIFVPAYSSQLISPSGSEFRKAFQGSTFHFGKMASY